MTRVAVLRDPAVPAGIGQFAIIQSVAPSVGVDVIPVNLSEAAEIERTVAAFAHSANGGLILTASALSAVHRDLIITLAAQHKLPAVYQERNYVAGGGLISYGPNFPDQFRNPAATLVEGKDRRRGATMWPPATPTRARLEDRATTRPTVSATHIWIDQIRKMFL